MHKKEHNTAMEDSYTFQYSFFKKSLAVSIFLLLFGFGCFCIYIGTKLTVFIGVLISVSVVMHMIDIVLFKSLTINKDVLTKQWYFFGKKTIKIDNLYAYCTRKIWKGLIIFGSRNTNSFIKFHMGIETFLLYRASLEDIKNILISFGVISENEACWKQKKKVNFLKRIFK